MTDRETHRVPQLLPPIEIAWLVLTAGLASG